MSPLAQRGRILFLILATLIIFDGVSRFVRPLIFTDAHFTFRESVLVPAVIIFIIVSLWQLEPRHRRFRPYVFLIYGGGCLFQYARLMYRMALATPPEEADRFAERALAIFGLPVLEAVFFIVASMMLVFSPSLKDFFEYQTLHATNPWTNLGNWVLGLIKGDGLTPEGRKFWHDFENRTRYPVLTRAILDSLDDQDLFDAIHDYVDLKVEKDYGNEFAIVSSMPRGFQAVYSIWGLKAEVDNGGFYQFFYNKNVDWAFMALEGYKLFGEDKLAAITARAIELYLQEESEQRKYQSDNPLEMIEKFVEGRKASTLPELDKLFYECDGCDGAEYIRAHIDEFVAD